MKPIIYGKDETEFASRGLGTLTDALECEVTEERNGSYEAQLTYPADGIHIAEIKNDNIIVAKPNEKGSKQPFRIYRVSKPMDGKITAFAEHISYQQNDIPVSPFTATGAHLALTGLKDNAAVNCPFTVYTDIVSSNTYTQTVPASFRSRLAGVEGSILDIFGGEYEFDVWRVNLWAHRGADNGATIRYGKNLLDLKQEENIQNVVTGVYPYWTDEETTVILPEKTIGIVHDYSYGRVKVLDLSDKFEEAPTVEQLRNAATEYVTQSGIAEPDVSIKVDFIHLYQTVGYEDIAPLEEVGLCDTITVHFETLGINVKSKVVSYKYDALAERYTEMQIGAIRPNLVRSVNEIKKEQITSEEVRSAAEEATQLIINNKGGYVRTLDTDGDGHDDEQVFMDALETVDAVRVWRWNLSGFGYSRNGYNGTYGTAITMNGEIVADYITTGTMSANRVRAGVLQSTNGLITLNLDTGVMLINGDSLEQSLSDLSTGMSLAADKISWIVATGTSVSDFTLTDRAALLATSELRLTATDNQYSGSLSVSLRSGAPYGFTLASDGYYTSTNTGVDNSYAISRVQVTTAQACILTLNCIHSAENGYDISYIGKLDTSLTLARTEAQENIFRTFNVGSTTPVKVALSIPAGTHFFEVKFTKDSSAASGNDSFKFKKVEGGASSLLVMTSGGTEITSTEITFTGLVTFNDLSQSGSTTINGANITTGIIAANRIDAESLVVKHLSGADGTFTGTLLGVDGTFEGTLSATSGTFSNLKALSGGYINIGGWVFNSNGMEYSGGVFDFEYSGGWAKLAGTAPMQIGPWTNGIVNQLTLYGTAINCMSSETGYNMKFWVPGTNECSLTPMTSSTCNIGTNSYWFDYMHANHFSSHSLRASKKNVRNLEESDYKFMDIRPVLYEEKQSETGRKYMGFIAEELETSCEYGVMYDKENGELSGIDYSRITVMLVKELQRVTRKLSEIEEKIA